MTRLISILTGYRDDLHLPTRWWHRLYRVVVAISVVAAFVWLLDSNTRDLTIISANTWNPDGTIKEFGRVVATHPGEGWTVTLVEAALMWLVLANAYYRGVIYIA